MNIPSFTRSVSRGSAVGWFLVLLLVCGAGTVAVGCGMIWLPLGVIVAGGALIAFSLLSGPGGDEQ